MSSEHLGKLEELAGKRAERSRHLLEKEQQKLRQLENHSSELRSINQEYQEEPLGKSSVAPQQLAQRRAFVGKLTEKLEELAAQREQKRQCVETQAHEHQLHSAQHAAINIINTQRLEHASVVEKLREQQQLDEIGRGQHFEKNSLQMEKDDE